MSAPAGGLVAHHFDDLPQQRSAGVLGMWAFLVTEVMFFGGLFTGYAAFRSIHHEAFAAASRHLDIVLGTFNTVVLIGSSLTMALAVDSAHKGRREATAGWLVATILLGSVFLGVKVVEYAHKVHEHLVPAASFAWPEADVAVGARVFFAFYFTMTGMHAFHMVVGIPIIALVARRAWRGLVPAEHPVLVEFTGLYWHFVDIVWIFLFPLLYLLGRHA